jgi:DNA-binding transcriptional regulator YdaS (Cro superfamily)
MTPAERKKLRPKAAQVRALVVEAAKLAGSETKLAERADVSQTAIWKAKKTGKITGDLAVAIDDATEGRVPKYRFRPDLFDAPAQGVAA